MTIPTGSPLLPNLDQTVVAQDEEVTLDFGGIQDFTPAPTGTYRLVCVAFEKLMKQGGTYPYWHIKMEIDQDPFEGKPITETSTFHPDARWKMKEILTGITGQRFDIDNMTIRPGTLVGKKCLGDVIITEYDATDNTGVTSKRKSNKVDTWYPLHYVTQQPVTNGATQQNVSQHTPTQPQAASPLLSGTPVQAAPPQTAPPPQSVAQPPIAQTTVAQPPSVPNFALPTTPAEQPQQEQLAPDSFTI